MWSKSLIFFSYFFCALSPLAMEQADPFDTQHYKKTIAFSTENLDTKQKEVVEIFNTKAHFLEHDKFFLKKNYLEADVECEYSNGTRKSVEVGNFLSGTSGKAPIVTSPQNPIDYLLAEPDSIIRNSQNKKEQEDLKLILGFNGPEKKWIQEELTNRIKTAWSTARQFSYINNKKPIHGLQWLASEESGAAKTHFLKSLHYTHREKAFLQEGKLDERLSHTETWALSSIALTQDYLIKNNKRQNTGAESEPDLSINRVILNLYSRLEPCLMCRTNLESACTKEQQFFLAKIIGEENLQERHVQEESKGDNSEIKFEVNVYSLSSDDWKPRPLLTKFPLPKEKI